MTFLMEKDPAGSQPLPGARNKLLFLQKFKMTGWGFRCSGVEIGLNESI